MRPLLARLAFIGIFLYLVVHATGTGAQTAPDTSRYMVNQLLDLEQQKRDLDVEIKKLTETSSELSGIKTRLDGLAYPKAASNAVIKVKEHLKDKTAEETIVAMDAAITRFHDPFFELFNGNLPEMDEEVGDVQVVYNEMERTLTARETNMKDALWELQAAVGAMKSEQEKKRVLNDFAEGLYADLSQEQFKKLRGNLTQILDVATGKNKKVLTAAEKRHADVTNEINDLRSSLEASRETEEKKQDLDEILFKFGLPSMIVLIIVLHLVNELPTIVAIIAKNKEMVPKQEKTEVLNIITVLLLIISILVLGARGQIEGSTLGTLFGSIAGYVLGSLSKSKRQAPQGGAGGNP
jgi:hypothetical protein